jgi:L-fuconolactonase
MRMLGFPIVDAHVHFWDTRRLRYPWLDGIPLLNRPYLPDDYRESCGPVEIGQSVFVQCECDPSQYRDEVDWGTSLAAREPRIGGLVAWAPLEKGPAVREELEALAENRLVKGIRRIIQYEPQADFCLRPEFVYGVQMLSDFGFSFDVCIASIQMENTISLVRRCPEVRFVLDHIGKPNIRDGEREPWWSHLKMLSRLPNVWCKVSGLVTEADHRCWTGEGLKPYLDHVLACFGLDRVLFGGDWPVVLLASDYPRWAETLKWAVQGCSNAELRALFHDNAVAVYRLARGT